MEISGHTRLGGLLGSPVAHSISPAMQNAAFQMLGLDFVYLCFDTGKADLSTIVEALREMNTYGFNVTMPDKQQIMPYLDEITDAARLIGAVNTVKNEDGRLIGYNTDGLGFTRSLKDCGYDLGCGEMTLLGAGGAASSIAVQSAMDGVPALHILNRRSGKSYPNAERLAAAISRETPCRAEVLDLDDPAALCSCLSRSSLLVNATNVGMEPQADATPLKDLAGLHSDLFVYDCIYHPKKTRLLKEAEERGCRTGSGLYMLLYQGAEAFTIWTGQKMPVDEIRRLCFS